MKTFSEYKNHPKSRLVSESASTQYTLFPKNKYELQQMIKEEIKKQGCHADLNHIDTSAIKDMSMLFWKEYRFDGDVSGWDVSNVTDMSHMFYMARAFNGDVSGWDVSNVTDMHGMFYNAKSFNQDISGWDVSKVEKTKFMFSECPCPEKYQPKFKHTDII